MLCFEEDFDSRGEELNGEDLRGNEVEWSEGIKRRKKGEWSENGMGNGVRDGASRPARTPCQRLFLKFGHKLLNLYDPVLRINSDTSPVMCVGYDVSVYVEKPYNV